MSRDAMSGLQRVDWEARNLALTQSNRSNRDRAQAVRRDAERLQHETEARAKWHLFENNLRLDHRASELDRWRQELSRLASALIAEHEVLTEAKERCERGLESKTIPSEVIIECLAQRSARRAHEKVINDDLELALINEKTALNEAKTRLRSQCDLASEKLKLLEEMQQRIEIDLNDKEEALRIDRDQLRLNENSANLTNKPDATRLPAKLVQPATWESYSASNASAAESALASSQNLRESIFHAMEETTNFMRAARDNSDFQFRKRIFEIKRAIQELQYNLDKTEDEISEQSSAIRGLESSIASKLNPLKLAETRLENRKTRPQVELCHDEPLDGFVSEVKLLKESIQMLEDKLDGAKETLSDLLMEKRTLKEDLAKKKEALAIEQRCFDLRARLVSHDMEISSQMEKNLRLTGVLRSGSNRVLENAQVKTNHD